MSNQSEDTKTSASTVEDVKQNQSIPSTTQVPENTFLPSQNGNGIGEQEHNMKLHQIDAGKDAVIDSREHFSNVEGELGGVHDKDSGNGKEDALPIENERDNMTRVQIEIDVHQQTSNAELSVSGRESPAPLRPPRPNKIDDVEIEADTAREERSEVEDVKPRENVTKTDVELVEI